MAVNHFITKSLQNICGRTRGQRLDHWIGRPLLVQVYWSIGPGQQTSNKYEKRLKSSENVACIRKIAASVLLQLFINGNKMPRQ